MSGIQQALRKFGFADFFADYCDDGYEVVRHWDRIYSRWLGIPTSIKVTTVKPSGTVSLLAGATPGVHCTHSKYYFRTFRISSSHPLVQRLITNGYRLEFAVEDKTVYENAGGSMRSWDDSINLANCGVDISSESEEMRREYARLGGTYVAYFPVKEKNFTKSKFDISLWEQLLLARELQNKWSDNSVSITVTFKEEEAPDLKSAIEYVGPYVKTLSFLPLEDHNYAQAPYQECEKDEYEEYAQSLKKLRLVSLRGGTAKGEKYCATDVCEL
jgi:ribonucleotide reductase alpha subunit